MNVRDMTRTELLKIENYLPVRDFNGIVIVPTGETHDSGFGMLKFILVNGYEVVGAVGGAFDVIYLDGIGGYGINHSEALRTRKKDVIDWAIDHLPKSDCLRLFTFNSKLKLPDVVLSVFEIYASKNGDDQLKMEGL